MDDSTDAGDEDVTGRPGPDAVLRRVAALEDRLARIEARLGVGDRPGDGPAQPARVGVPRYDAPRVPPQQPPPLPPPLPPRAAPLRSVLSTSHGLHAEPARPRAGDSPASTNPLPYAPRALRMPVPSGDFEQTIGLKWAGWVGGVVVVIGAALGIKFAYDQGWFLILPPAGRLALMSLGGFALIAAGEYVYRRIHVLAATGLFGAGVATLFLVGYAGHAYYQLYAQQTALVMMSLATLIGALIAVRGDLLSIAIIALLGGNLAPLVLGVGPSDPVPLLSHVLTLLVVALALAWRGHAPKWWALRVLVLATTSLWLTVVFSHAIGHRFQQSPPGFHPATLPFVLVYAALFEFELFLSTIPLSARPRWARWGLPVAAAASAPVPVVPNAGPRGDRWLAVAFSAAVTGLLVVAVLAIRHGATDVARGAWVLGIAAAYVGFGYALWLVGHDNDERQRLSVGFRGQAAALVVLAVPVALDGVWVVVGWAILSVIFATAGALLHLRVSRWAGVAVWRLAVLALGWWAVNPQVPVARRASHAAWFHLLGADVRAYTVIAWALALVGHAVAWIIHAEGFGPRSDEPARKAQRLFWVTSGMAALVWIAGSVAGLPPVGATLAIVVYAWLLLLIDVVNPRLRIAILAAAALLIATGKWAAVDILAARLSPDWSALAYEPVFNPVMGMGLVLSATMGLTYWRRRREWPVLLRDVAGGPGADAEEDRSLLLVVAAAMIALVTIAFTAEIDRVIEQAIVGPTIAFGWRPGQIRQLGWTMLWSGAAAAFAGAVVWLEPDRARRARPLRVVAGIAVVLAMKYLTLDTMVWRVMSWPAPVTPWANLQTLAAAVVFAGLLGSYLLLRANTDDPVRAAKGGQTAGFLAVLVPLWAVTFELDRVFQGMPKQFAFSIFWSAAAIALVIAGFRFRVAGLRHFGLGLFAFTLAKVVFVDLSQARTGYRVLSFLGLGLLLLGTSVVYGKLSPRLLREKGGPDTTPADTPTAA